MDKNFTRLLDTLAIVQRNIPMSTPQIRARLMARGHDVSLRTIQRDLEDLAVHYPLDCDRRSKPFAWRWRPGSKQLSVPGMDWPEALSFYMLDTYLDGVMPASTQEHLKPYVQEARRKLTQHFNELPLKQWPKRVRVLHQGVQNAPLVSKAVHTAVTEAVLLGKCLAIKYQGLDSNVLKDYEVAPLGLVQQGFVFYLPVRFEGYGDVRTLAVHRIRQARLLDRPSGIGEFDFEGWLHTGPLGFGGQGRVDLVLTLHADLPDRLAEAPLSMDQQISRKAAGTAELSATVMDTIQLRRWLLSQADRLEVRAPAALREEMIATLSRASLRYHMPATVCDEDRP